MLKRFWNWLSLSLTFPHCATTGRRLEEERRIAEEKRKAEEKRLMDERFSVLIPHLTVYAALETSRRNVLVQDMQSLLEDETGYVNEINCLDDEAWLGERIELIDFKYLEIENEAKLEREKREAEAEVKKQRLAEIERRRQIEVQLWAEENHKIQQGIDDENEICSIQINVFKNASESSAEVKDKHIENIDKLNRRLIRYVKMRTVRKDNL